MIARRLFLKLLPAGFVTPALAGSVENIPITESAVEAVAMAARPARPFRWWVSHDGGEIFSDEFATHEEAVACAESYIGGCLVAECQQQDYDLHLDGDEILDMLRDRADDAGMIGDGEFIDYTAEQAQDLERMVNAAIREWVNKHGIDCTAWTFGIVRNKEEVTGLPVNEAFFLPAASVRPRPAAPAAEKEGA